MEKQFVWVHKLGEAESQGNLQGGTKSVSQVDGVSDMALACQLCGGGFRKGTMAFAHLDARHFSSSLYATGAIHAVTPLLELRGSESQVSLCMGSSRTAWDFRRFFHLLNP